jgi:hypothetical protein
MRGALHHPVHVRVLDGKTLVTKALIIGRMEGDQPTYLSVADDNAEYKVEWIQCPNERAPVSEKGGKNESKRATKDQVTYICGDAEPYKTHTLVTKKGDPSTHKITFAPPPKPECWSGEGAPTTPASSASAAASASAPPAASASAAPEASGSAAASAAAEPADSAAPAAGSASTAPSASAAEAPPKKKKK